MVVGGVEEVELRRPHSFEVTARCLEIQDVAIRPQMCAKRKRRRWRQESQRYCGYGEQVIRY